MIFGRPPGGFPGNDLFGQNNLTMPISRPRPVPQPITLTNSGYPVLDLISGLTQVFTRPRPTMTGYPDPTPTFPEMSPQGGFGGDMPDYGAPRRKPGSIFDIDFGPGVIEENPQPVEYDEWGQPIKRYPMDERPSPPMRKFPQPLLGGPVWEDDAGQTKWLERWNIQPSQDARYLPDYPDAEDDTLGADIRRDWHNAYKDYAFGQIRDNAPQFVEHVPQPKPKQSYGDFMGDIQNVASTLLNRGAGLLGSGIGQALNFIPGMGAIMELIGKGANIAGTVAGATSLGSEKAGMALNLLGSVANGAAGGASAGAEEYGPPMPNADQMPQETYGPAMPPFKNPTAPSQNSWLQQQLQEMNERQARREFLDDSGNWRQGPMPVNTPQQPQSVVFKKPGEEEKPAFNPNYVLGEGEYFPSPQQIWQKMDEAEAAGLDPYEALGVKRPDEDSNSQWMQGDIGKITQPIDDRAKYEIDKYTPNVSTDKNGRLQTRYNYNPNDPQFQQDLKNVIIDDEDVRTKPYVTHVTKTINGKRVDIPDADSGATIGVGSDMAQMWQKDIEKFGRDQGYSEEVIADLKQFGKSDDGTAGPKGAAAQTKVDEFLANHPDFEMTPNQVDKLLDKRLKEATPVAERRRRELQAQGKDLSPEEYAGIVSGSYVKGAGGFRSSDAYKQYKAGQGQAAKDAWAADTQLTKNRAEQIGSLAVDKDFRTSRANGEQKWKKAFENYEQNRYPGYMQGSNPWGKNGEK